MQSLTDLIFALIDEGHEFGVPAHQVERVRANELIGRSVRAAEKADRENFRRAARRVNQFSIDEVVETAIKFFLEQPEIPGKDSVKNG